VTVLLRCLSASGLLLMLGFRATGMAQDRPAGVLTDVPAHLINAPFQANQTFTRVYADGREIPDPGSTLKYARSNDGCLRQDRLQWKPYHPPSRRELEQFNAAKIGSSEEQALDEVSVTLNSGPTIYWWINKEPLPGPKTNWLCRASARPAIFPTV